MGKILAKKCATDILVNNRADQQTDPFGFDNLEEQKKLNEQFLFISQQIEKN